MDDALGRLRLDYAPLMLRYLAQQDESGLKSAYDLGREAMGASVGLLDVIRVHNEVFLGVVAQVRDVNESRSVAHAASMLLLDLVASFEMSQRGFLGAQRGRDEAAEQG